MQSCEMQFSRIFESGKYMDLSELSDASIRTDDGCSFDIHRVILAKNNDYFRRMFVGMGKRRRKFHIPGISGGCLSDILSHIYTKDIQITDKNIADLIVGADYLLVEDLQKKIRRCIERNLTEVNCLRILLAAHQTSDNYTFQTSFRFIQTTFEEIMRCQIGDDLVHLPLDILERILSNRSLNVYNETTVWKAIVAWTQKDNLFRMSCIPRLLLTLATEDMGEELATEILQHEIISHNFFMKDLTEITSSNDLSTNIDELLTLLRSYSKRFTEPVLRHRIPPQLFVAWADFGDEQSLYISYDENANLWRKITKVNHEPDALIVVGHNIYIFDNFEETCKKFDLKAMSWVRMRSFRETYPVQYYVVAIDECIYILGKVRGFKHVVLVYNTVNNRWHNSIPLHNISHIAAVAFKKKIYVVGNSKISDGMMMQMFDPDSQQWSIMSPPTVHHSEFSMVAYHRKIFLIGDSDTEVFDPATNQWKELPGAFGERSWPKAIVISDQIIVCDTHSYRFVYWNNEQECWENTDVKDAPEELFMYNYKFSTIDDIETIRMITKQNRHPGTQMEKLYYSD